MNKLLSKILKIGLPILLGVFLIWYSYNKFTPEQLRNIKYYFTNANYTFVAISVLCGFLSHISRAVRWNYLLKPLGYYPKMPNNIMAVGVAYLMNLGVPRSGEVSRALVLNKYENIPVDRAFGTIIAERVADLLILLSLVALAFITQFNTLRDYLASNFPLAKIATFAGIGFMGVVLAFWFVNKSRSNLSKKIKSFLNGIKDGIMSIARMERKWAFVGHTVFIWTMYVMMFYLCTYALPQTRLMTFDVVLMGFVVGSFAIAFTNGGFGSYPFFIATIFTLFGITEDVGTAFGWIVWTSQFAMILVFGGLSFLFLPIYNRNK